MSTKNIKNKRRHFMKMLGMGAVLTTSSAFAAKGGRSLKSNSFTQTVQLSEEQKDTLFYIFQEEKVARDVYITLGKLYPNEATFANIQISEQEHILSAQVLCERYGLDTSMVNLSQEEGYVGLLELDSMQTLYDSCVSIGSEGLLSALRVGEEIEITDITDLEEAAEGMPLDVVNVYEHLKDGSLNHLDAFQKAIARTEKY